MNRKLAVFTYDLGASFIDKHLVNLSPNGSVAVGGIGVVADLAMMWPISIPVFNLGSWRLGLMVRVAQRVGLSYEWLLDRAVAKFLRLHNVEVVLGEYLDQFLDFVPIVERLGLPYVIQGHGVDVSAKLREPGMAERYLAYHSARAVLVRCELHRQRLIELGLPSEKVHVNYGGVNVPAHYQDRGPNAAKRLLAVGLMVPKKSPIYLLEAFRLASITDSSLSLDYIGGGPLFEAANQFVEACGLVNKVRLHGVASEQLKKQLFRECGVFVQHSLTSSDGNEEGLPAAIQEAMANGLAVVSTRHAGIPEAVIEGVTGLLVDEGDVASMAKAFIGIGPQAAAMGRAGHKEALTKHSWPCEKQRLLNWLYSAA